jgi:hypothetical protein
MTLEPDQIQQIINNYLQNFQIQQVTTLLQAQVVTLPDGSIDYDTTIANLAQITPYSLMTKVASPPVQTPPVNQVG